MRRFATYCRLELTNRIVTSLQLKCTTDHLLYSNTLAEIHDKSFYGILTEISQDFRRKRPRVCWPPQATSKAFQEPPDLRTISLGVLTSSSSFAPNSPLIPCPQAKRAPPSLTAILLCDPAATCTIGSSPSPGNRTTAGSANDSLSSWFTIAGSFSSRPSCPLYARPHANTLPLDVKNKE